MHCRGTITPLNLYKQPVLQLIRQLDHKLFRVIHSSANCNITNVITASKAKLVSLFARTFNFFYRFKDLGDCTNILLYLNDVLSIHTFNFFQHLIGVELTSLRYITLFFFFFQDKLLLH